MRVASEVTRRKFDAELALVRSQVELLQQRGVFLLETTHFPCVDFLVVPRRPLAIAVPPPLGVSVPEGAKALIDAPALSARAVKVRFDLTDYDLRAPSLTFLDPWTDEALDFASVFRGFEYERDRGIHPVLLDVHPTTGKPFLCVRGVREYHEHPQHTGDDWLLYRGSMNVFSAIMELWRVAIDLTRPVLDLDARQLHWVADPKI